MRFFEFSQGERFFRFLDSVDVFTSERFTEEIITQKENKMYIANFLCESITTRDRRSRATSACIRVTTRPIIISGVLLLVLYGEVWRRKIDWKVRGLRVRSEGIIVTVILIHFYKF